MVVVADEFKFMKGGEEEEESCCDELEPAGESEASTPPSSNGRLPTLPERKQKKPVPMMLVPATALSHRVFSVRQTPKKLDINFFHTQHIFSYICTHASILIE